MSEKYPQPRWWLLYLILPLAAALFWLIQRMRPSGVARDLLCVGALLILGGYLEVWHLLNRAALAHHPLGVSAGQPIYYAREFVGSRPAQAGNSLGAVFVTGSHDDDVFAIPTYIGEPAPAVAELPGSAETTRTPGQTAAPWPRLPGREHAGRA